MVFQDWWRTTELLVPKLQQLQFLGFFKDTVIPWKHRKGCVFEIAYPSAQQIVKDEAAVWCMAGTKGLSGLWP